MLKDSIGIVSLGKFYHCVQNFT